MSCLLIAFMLGSCTTDGGQVRPESQPSELTSPAEKLSVAYVVRPNRVQKGDTPKATLRNTGNVTLEYGNVYTLQFKSIDGWEPVEQPEDPRVFCMFTGEAYLLEPGATKTQRITVCDRDGEPRVLVPGLYRVIKILRANSATGSVRAEALFRVKR